MQTLRDLTNKNSMSNVFASLHKATNSRNQSQNEKDKSFGERSVDGKYFGHKAESILSQSKPMF